jgi:hypothetical protein
MPILIGGSSALPTDESPTTNAAVAQPITVLRFIISPL